MSDLVTQEPEYGPPGGEPVGVVEALRMGWRMMMADFWPIWLLGLVVYAIQAGVNLVLGCIPYIGACFQLVAAVLVQAPLFVGLIYAVTRVIDGAPAQVGDVFEGFRQRYGPSVVAILPPMAVYLVGLLLVGGIVGVAAAIGAEAGRDEEVVIALVIGGIVALPLFVAMLLVLLLFMFCLVAVWDHPESGWQAVKASVRVVKAHYLSTLGFAILMWLIALAAGLLGLLACIVGIFFTGPFTMVWLTAAMVYLYRSWTGRPLSMAVGEAAPAEGPGPVPPSSVEPPVP